MSSTKRNPIARRRALRREIAEHGEVSVNELCELLDASPATIRRDLSVLAQEGKVSRGYGGASVPSMRPAEEALAVRAHKFVKEKQAIARVALDFITPGNTLFLGDGSTVLALARDIALTDIELFIATPAVNISEILVSNPKITVCLLGGFVRQTSHATGGYFAEAMVDQINADLAITSCDALSLSVGMCYSHAVDAALAKKMSLKSTRTMALINHAKIDSKARICGTALEDIDIIITEKRHPKMEQLLEKTKVRVVCAE
ncbi:MAG: DeoR/GlpR family transcriptional regulator of sugar metabolism [Parasphingorhabdus sp.]|jgi:DeoR/GlpR family transcriptional regulator of sugar metabolism